VTLKFVLELNCRLHNRLSKANVFMSVNLLNTYKPEMTYTVGPKSI